MPEKLTEAQSALLQKLTAWRGVTLLRRDEAETAISMAATAFIALGPNEEDGSVAAMITQEGRDVVAGRLALANQDGGRADA